MIKQSGFDRDEDICTRKMTKVLEADKSVQRYAFQPKGSRIDLFVTGDTGTYAIELKNRHFPSTAFKEEGWILENHKFDALMAAQENSGYTPIYLNFFEDDCYCEWQLDTLEKLDRHHKKCSETTAENYHKGEVDKERIFLKINEGKVTPFYYDDWGDSGISCF